MPAAAAKKTLYHSELVQMGEVQVTVQSDVQQSKYQGKPPYVILKIDRAERLYNCENQACEEFFNGTKGQTFVLQATGTREEAQIEYVRDGEPGEPDRPARAPAPQQRRPAPAKAPAARPPQRPPAAAPQQQRSAAPNGQTVGMAMNNACMSCAQEGIPFDLKIIAERATGILRLAAWFEAGNLMPKAGKVDPVAEAMAQPEPEPEPEPEPAESDNVPF